MNDVYRWPAEFEAIDAVWMTYPHEPTTWPGCFDQACEQYDYLMAQVSRFARVELIGSRHRFVTNDSWIRDYGPLFVFNQHQKLIAHDFSFNGWGGKYGRYDDDDEVPVRIAHHIGIPIHCHEMILEGGSIETNGRGVLLTTEQCLLNANRNPHLTRRQIEQKISTTLGVDRFVWLPGGIEGDDTDGHIDDVARFVAADHVLLARAQPDHPDHALLERNWHAMAEANQRLNLDLWVEALPMPQPIHYDYPADKYSSGGRHPIPASYANFLIVNDAVLVPTFGQPADEQALRIIDFAMPQHQVVDVRCEKLVVGLGAIHCLTMQQPSRPA